MARLDRFILSVALATSCLAISSNAAEDKVQFNRDIRPILSDNCFHCHGPDKSNRKAEMQLDVRDLAIHRGAIVPGKPDESELVTRIFAEDQDDLMPPPESHKKLSDAQKELLKRWIAEGAEYEPHWAYLTPTRLSPPTVENTKWVRTPVDAFVLRELEKRNVTPSKEADKRTLLRRLSLDLTGLPPTPEEMAKFVKDKSSKAYERQVDRLLNSPHFGERMAAGWLDLVRFTDTVGYHGDQNQNAFPYRDYVINAFNRNKPFDQFTIEQIAGDLLPNPTTEQRVATGFNRLNMMTREGGAQAKEYIAKYQADRVRTVSTAFLGSTMGCAECHDHKFDPFSTKDFYAMEAFFADVKQWGVYADYSYTPNPDLLDFNNDYPFPPEIEVDSPYLQQRILKLRDTIATTHLEAAAKLKKQPESKAAFQEWRKQSLAFLEQTPSGWSMPQPTVSWKLKEGEKAATNFTINADQTITLTEKHENLQVKLPISNMRLAAIRVEVVPRKDAMEDTGKRKREVTSLNLSATVKGSSGKEQKLSFVHADADHADTRYSMGLPVIGVKDQWRISNAPEKRTAVWLVNQPIEAKEGDVLTVNLGSPGLTSVRISVTPFASTDPLQSGRGEQLAAALKKTFSGKDDRNWISRTYLLSTGWDTNAFTEIHKLENEVRQCRNGRGFTMVTESREPLITRVLPRGNWQNDSGEVVEPSAPHFLAQIPKNNERATRLDLARWLVAPENPLTSRTFVNRLWKQFFGTGISAVVDDLGAQGEWPTHPELLDWMAVEFRESGWDVKHMVKLIVMSSAYRQDSNQREELKDTDPANRLISFQSPRRLEAEFVRDNALFIAGLLKLDIGGPSAKPYQPAGYYANLQFPERDYVADKDDHQYRRGIYTHWQRTFLHPMMANFDAPSREECTAIRTVSNTPQQGLTLLNDPTFVEASRVFAEQVLLSKAKTDSARLDLVFQKALGRSAKANEITSLTTFLAKQREHYNANPTEADKFVQVGLAPVSEKIDKVELAAWANVCRVVLNLHETITRY